MAKGTGSGERAEWGLARCRRRCRTASSPRRPSPLWPTPSPQRPWARCSFPTRISRKPRTRSPHPARRPASPLGLA
eukprot:6902203-Alexandrium_andersonii.AAC.1